MQKCPILGLGEVVNNFLIKVKKYENFLLTRGLKWVKVGRCGLKCILGFRMDWLNERRKQI